jgi:signal transduction histidine kinase
VTAESVLGAGSTFTVRFPLAPASDDEAVGTPAYL